MELDACGFRSGRKEIIWNHLLYGLFDVFFAGSTMIPWVRSHPHCLQVDEWAETAAGERVSPGSPWTPRAAFEPRPPDSQPRVLSLPYSCFLSPFPGSLKQNKPTSCCWRGRRAQWGLTHGGWQALWLISAGHPPSTLFPFVKTQIRSVLPLYKLALWPWVNHFPLWTSVSSL